MVRKNWALFVILAAAAILFARLLGAPSLSWDDDSNIFSNPYYRAGQWATFWQEPYFGLYVPVTNMIWGLLFALGKGAVWPFRVLNLTLHLTNIVLVYALLKSLASRWRLSESQTPVWIGTALFAFHPLQVEAVGWLSGGRDLLAATFTLACILSYFRGTHWKNFALATVFFVLAVLAKPNSVVIPAVIPLLEWLLRPERFKQTLMLMGWWLAFTIWPITFTMEAQAEHIPTVEIFVRPWIMMDSYAFYASKLFWPWRLSGNYARTPDAVLASFTTLQTGVIFTVAFVVSMLWAWRRDRRFLIALGWMLLLLPVSGIVPFGFQKISTTADHYHYLPMFIVAAISMLGIEHLRQGHRQAVDLVTGVLLVVLVAVTALRVEVWRSNKNFFTDMVETAPDTYSTAIGMSVVSCLEDQNYDEGVHWTEVALAAQPEDILAIANQAYCYLHAKNYIRVTELESYLNNMDLDMMASKYPTAYSSFLASVGTAEMELREFEVGFQYLCEAFRVKPSEPNHSHNLEVATDIMRAQGLSILCDRDFQVAPGDEDDVEPEEPGDEGAPVDGGQSI